jgi:hypothetical protein
VRLRTAAIYCRFFNPQNHWAFRLRPSSGITQGFRNWVCFRYKMTRGGPTLLGLLERDQSSRLAPSKGPNRVGSPSPHTWTETGQVSENVRRGSAALTTRHPLYPQQLALTSPTRGGRSVGIVRLRTQATVFSFSFSFFSSNESKK